jgi:hypothetical protein
MRSDPYVRAMLTIIAGCLLVLAARAITVMPSVRAATIATCTGDMRATTAGPVQASLGPSYKIDVKCE